MAWASSPANSNKIKLNQRLHFLLASFESKDAAERAQSGARELLADLVQVDNHSPARHALLEVLRGLDACSKHAARLRLQLALTPILGSLDKQQLSQLLPTVVKQSLACLSAHRRDAGVAQALAALLAEAAQRLAAEEQGCQDGGAGGGAGGFGGGGAAAAVEGRRLFEELLLPLVRSSYRDPEATRVAAGCQVLSAVLSALAPAGAAPAVSVALRAGLAAALEHMWGGSAARRVAAAYTPMGPWAAAVGGAQMGAEGARRLACICCRGAVDKDVWQVRREALHTLAALVTTVQADHAASGAASAPGAPHAPGAGPGSGAMEALSAHRARLLAALEGCRYDAIAAVRLAAAEARSAVLMLPEPPEAAGDGGACADGGGGSDATRGGGASPARAKPGRSPLKKPAVVSAGKGFQRPAALGGELLDFGVQVFAPPSPPRRGGQRLDDDDASPGRGQDQDAAALAGLRSSVDAFSQTPGGHGGWPPAQDAALPPPWLHRLHDGASPGALRSTGAAAGDLAAPAAEPDGARLEVAHHVHGRVEIVVGSAAELDASRAAHDAAAVAAAAGAVAAAAAAEGGGGRWELGAGQSQESSAVPSAGGAAQRQAAGSHVGDVVARVLQQAAGWECEAPGSSQPVASSRVGGLLQELSHGGSEGSGEQGGGAAAPADVVVHGHTNSYEQAEQQQQWEEQQQQQQQGSATHPRQRWRDEQGRMLSGAAGRYSCPRDEEWDEAAPEAGVQRPQPWQEQGQQGRVQQGLPHSLPLHAQQQQQQPAAMAGSQWFPQQQRPQQQRRQDDVPLRAAPQKRRPGAGLASGGATPGAWDEGVSSIEDGGDLLMALSWRLQRLARGFGHHDGADAQLLQSAQAQLRASSGHSQPLQQARWGGGGGDHAAVGGLGLAGLRLSAPNLRPGAGAAAPMALPLPGGFMPPPQSLEDGEDGAAGGDLGFELCGMQQELAQHAQQPLGTLQVGALPPQQAGEGGADDAAGLPPAALVMLRERWEEEAGRRAWRVCGEQVDYVLRSSGCYAAAPGSPVRQLLPPDAARPGSDGPESPMRRCWALQQAAAVSAANEAAAWSPLA
ncbi:MAG: hypothetical protein J3K34DRAFT_517093 [Monoraphidium minutum]|nr:MAG: hypothetical protein J3K34DRAFT_517093 [Monoraphidium minutum]